MRSQFSPSPALRATSPLRERCLPSPALRATSPHGRCPRSFSLPGEGDGVGEGIAPLLRGEGNGVGEVLLPPRQRQPHHRQPVERNVVDTQRRIGWRSKRIRIGPEPAMASHRTSGRSSSMRKGTSNETTQKAQPSSRSSSCHQRSVTLQRLHTPKNALHHDLGPDRWPVGTPNPDTDIVKSTSARGRVSGERQRHSSESGKPDGPRLGHARLGSTCL
jgi:hypothetical protein